MDKSKTSTAPSRHAWGVALLFIGLLALVLGVFGAVYLQPGKAPQIASNAPAQPPATAMSQPQQPPAAGLSENRPPEETATAPESNSPAPTPPELQAVQAPPPAPAVDQTLPQTQATNPLPSLDAEAERLAAISPNAGPADIAAAGSRYWVEFGAYDRAFYADRLKQKLGQIDIDAMVGSASGRQGRTYLRVRTTNDSDHATAAAQRDRAHSALHIAPLLHRADAFSPTPPGAPEAQAATPPHHGYWVQFGAFREQQNAEQTLAELQKNGIQASVIERKDGGEGSLYLIRVSRLPSRAQAEQVAQQGSAALHSSDVMIRESRGAGLHSHPSSG